MTTNLNQGFPRIAVPLIDPAGSVSMPWYQFFRALWLRTGSGGGIPSAGVAEVDTGGGLSGGPINTATPTGTIVIQPITNATLLANTSGVLASPSGTTVSTLLDTAIDNTQGDILYRNASGWTFLPPGTSGQFLETQGGAANPQWATSHSLLNVQYFTTPGTTTYTPTAGTNQCFAWVQGGGAGGGGAPSTAAGHAAWGSAGAGGAYCEGFFAVGTLSGATVTVGAGGNGGIAGANNGQAGGDSSIGATLVAHGGGAGQAGTDVSSFPAASSTAATGNTATGGSLNISGGTGLAGILLSATFPSYMWGGASLKSIPVQGPLTSGAGTAATVFGGGGTGGLSLNGAGTAAGGNGAKGAVVIMEFT